MPQSGAVRRTVGEAPATAAPEEAPPSTGLNMKRPPVVGTCCAVPLVSLVDGSWLCMSCNTVLETDDGEQEGFMDPEDGEEEGGAFTWPCCAAPFVSPLDGEWVCVHCKRRLLPPPTWTPF